MTSILTKGDDFMKSGELARLAGVTVRTLRHYRTIGLLPEPKRDDNGYCNYSEEDYFRLLRIKNLTALGFALADIKNFLDHPTMAPDANLDALDAQLQAEIARLEQQRQMIAQLKAAHMGADIPPMFAEFLALLSHEALPEHLLQMEINGFLSAAHSLNEEELHEIVDFYKKLVEQHRLSEYSRLCYRLYRGDESMSEAERDALAADLARFLTTILGPIPGNDTTIFFEDDTDLFEDDGHLLGLTQANATLVQDIYNRMLKLLTE